MEYKHIKNITNILKDFFKRNRNHSETIRKKPFTDDIEFEPAYRLTWITPDGTLILEDNSRSAFKRETDHKRTILVILKKYYITLNKKDKQTLLKTFFGDTYNNTKLIHFFQSEIIYTEDLPKELWGSFESEGHPKVISHRNGKIYYRPFYRNYITRFMSVTGIVRLRLKSIPIDNMVPEQNGFNIEAHTKLTLNQSQFLREFIILNNLQFDKSVFIDDNTPYKTISSSLGLDIKPKFNSFGHAYRLLESKNPLYTKYIKRALLKK